MGAAPAAPYMYVDLNAASAVTFPLSPPPASPSSTGFRYRRYDGQSVLFSKPGIKSPGVFDQFLHEPLFLLDPMFRSASFFIH